MPHRHNVTRHQQICLHVEECIEKSKLELPMLPAVTAQLLKLLNDDRYSAASLSDLIHRDQALAAHALRIANSPAFMASTKIVSLEQAVVRLGMRMLSHIALAASVGSQVFKVRGHKERLRDMWQHSLASGLFAKEIAKVCHLDVEIAFLCGLLHRIGRPIVLRTAVAEMARLGYTPVDVEIEEIMKEFSVRAGTLLADRWDLPPQVRECIVFCDNYQGAADYREEAMCIAYASAMAMYFLSPESMGETPIHMQPVIAELGLSTQEVDAILDRGDELIGVIEAMSG